MKPFLQKLLKAEAKHFENIEALPGVDPNAQESPVYGGGNDSGGGRIGFMRANDADLTLAGSATDFLNGLDADLSDKDFQLDDDERASLLGDLELI